MKQSISLIKPGWQLSSKVHAFTTTRQGGVSRPPFDSLNLALHVQDKKTFVLENRQRIESLLPNAPLWLAQQHTTDLLYYPEFVNSINVPTFEAPVADAVWTDQENQPCVVMTADCMPVLLAESHGQWVAAVHAGWKGLLNGVIENTVQQICALKHTDPANIQAWIGPAISQVHFEVGGELLEKFQQKHAFTKAYFLATDVPEKYRADLNGIAVKILQDLGVTDVLQSRLCTYAEPERFFSYRYASHHPVKPQEKGKTGRIASFIWIAEDR